MDTHPLLQIILMVVMSFINLAYVLAVKPFEELEFTKVEVINETTVYIATVFLMIYLDDNHFKGKSKDNLGWANIAIITLNISLNLTFIVFKTFIEVRDKCNNRKKNMIRKKRDRTFLL